MTMDTVLFAVSFVTRITRRQKSTPDPYFDVLSSYSAEKLSLHGVLGCQGIMFTNLHTCI